jgi:hypothetical protein
MASNRRTVFVLGAGFTRAFLPSSPLMTDDYGVGRILHGLGDLPTAKRVLGQELERNSGGQINIERLLTRLDGGMPYDANQGVLEEIRFLAAGLKRALVERIRRAREGKLQIEALHVLARQCVDGSINCISFNYDDVLDEALYLVSRAPHLSPGKKWHPDAGYGFLCPSSQAYAHRRGPAADWSSLQLLKLHGSLNWRIALGAQPPYGLDVLVHHETWVDPPVDLEPLAKEQVEDHLEGEPFIVPPLLVKSSLVEQPILRRLWFIAHRELSQAERVIFIGYSLPLTDIAAGVLFRESLVRRPRPEVRVVNYGVDENSRAVVRESYRDVCPWLADDQFDFRGAMQWSREWCARAG